MEFSFYMCCVWSSLLPSELSSPEETKAASSPREHFCGCSWSAGFISGISLICLDFHACCLFHWLLKKSQSHVPRITEPLPLCSLTKSPDRGPAGLKIIRHFVMYLIQVIWKVTFLDSVYYFQRLHLGWNGSRCVTPLLFSYCYDQRKINF